MFNHFLSVLILLRLANFADFNLPTSNCIDKFYLDFDGLIITAAAAAASVATQKNKGNYNNPQTFVFSKEIT